MYDFRIYGFQVWRDYSSGKWNVSTSQGLCVNLRPLDTRDEAIELARQSVSD